MVKNIRKIKINFKRPQINVDLRNIPGLNFIFQHTLTTLSLIPFAVALLIAFPTFQINLQDKTFKFTSILATEQSELATNAVKLGLKNSIDLQGGVSVKYQMATPTPTPSVTPTPTPTPTVTVTPSLSVTPTPEPETKEQIADNINKTERILRKRIEEIGLDGQRLYSTQGTEGRGGIITFSGDRESLGFYAPSFILTKGDVQIWVDNPDFDPSTTDSQSLALNPLLSKGRLDISKADIRSVTLLNDAKTAGYGLRVEFNDSVVPTLESASANVGRGQSPVGFMIVVDGIPSAIQSYPYTTALNPNVLFFTINGTDLLATKSLVSVLNNEVLPYSLSAVSNNNTSALVNVNTDTMRVGLLLGFILINAFILIRLRFFGLFTVIVNTGILAGTIAIFKLTNQILNIELIIGTLVGLVLVSAILFIYNQKLIQTDFRTLVNKHEIRDELRGLVFKLFFVPLCLFAIILNYLGIQFISTMVLSIAIVFIVFNIATLSIIPTLINELFILPFKHVKAK